jgi:uroporphyrinogen decarboxylase
VDRTPIWLMRQAGRALPEYRALKERYSFLELVQQPELAAEVTLQPIRRFGFDAAVLFSDILVVAEALGHPYRFRERGGIEMERAVRGAEEIERLVPEAVPERLAYVAQALRLLKAELGRRTALLGFAGSPWTLASFLMEGGSAREPTRAKALFYGEPRLYTRLLEKLTEAVTRHLQLQIDAGADAVQIFDSLGGDLAAVDYAAASGTWIARIIARLGRPVPVIVFVRGAHGQGEVLAQSGARVLSVDWTVVLATVRARLPRTVAVQGNLDPFLMTTTPPIVMDEARRILESMRAAPGHIFNLGHGLPPGAKLETIEALVRTVREFK